MTKSRRDFLKGASAAAAAFAGLRALEWRSAHAADYIVDPAHGIDKYGALKADPNAILDLPPGFSYSILSRTDDRMSDGLFTPRAPDGMATFAFPGDPDRCVIVRNHEVWPNLSHGTFGDDYVLAKKIPREKFFDFAPSGRPMGGGTTTLVYNLKSRRMEKSFLSLAGTAGNCCGGPTPWGSWLTCEETTELPGKLASKPHGYVFEVPSAARGLVDPIPLKAMGRFVHEAAAVDPLTGIVYLTEDNQAGLFYRYLPEQRGELGKGGRLQALALRVDRARDLRNWPADSSKTSGAGSQARLGESFDVAWLDMTGVDTLADDLKERGFAAGALRFARGEGLAYGTRRDGKGGEIFICCTSGGPKRIGQVWRYRPSPSEGSNGEKDAPPTLDLFVETDNAAILEKCDNVVVAPWGDVILCEDGDGEQYLRGVTPEGKLYTLARNAHAGKSEFAGACFAPDGRTMFVNIQNPGITLAVTGPWTKAG